MLLPLVELLGRAVGEELSLAVRVLLTEPESRKRDLCKFKDALGGFCPIRTCSDALLYEMRL